MDEAAAFLGIDVDRIWGLVVSGQVAAAPRSWPPRIRRSELEGRRIRLLSDGKIAPRRDDWLDVPAVAARLNLSVGTVRRLIDRGQVRSVRVGRLVRVRPEDLASYVAEARLKPGELVHLDPNHGRRRGSTPGV